MKISITVIFQLTSFCNIHTSRGVIINTECFVVQKVFNNGLISRCKDVSETGINTIRNKQHKIFNNNFSECY